MKKILILFLLIFCFNSKGYSLDFSAIFKPSIENEIKNFIKEHDKAYSKQNIEEVKTFYDENYISADGYNLNKLGEMLENTYSSYENIKYKSKINNIITSNNWAIIQMEDRTTAQVNPLKDKEIDKDKLGFLESESSYIIYLKKDKNNEWKIIQDDVLTEETTLKYGIAKKIDIELLTPMFIKNGGEYDLALNIKNPKDIVALASISREEISFPPNLNNEKYRKMPQEGTLERLVKANDKNLDEYGSATVGFTKISFNEEKTKARIEVLGMAYIVKRINMENTKIPREEMLVEKK